MLGKGLRDPAGLDCHDPDAVRAELDGPLPAKRLERIEGDLEAAHPGDGLRPPTAEGENHTRPTRDRLNEISTVPVRWTTVPTNSSTARSLSASTTVVSSGPPCDRI